MSTQPELKPIDANVLRIVRFAMLAGLLVFVGITQYVHSNAPNDAAQPMSDLAALRWVGFGLCAGAIAALAVLRGARQRAPVEKRGTLGLIGSAFAEGAGFMGAVYFFLGGGLDVFALALVIFLASWAILPADPDAV